MAIKEITVQELKDKLDNKEDFQLIDVREDFEVESANISGLHIPLANVLLEAEKVDRQRPVVIYCRSGRRSAAAISQLEQQFGLQNLYNLKGGILAWAQEIDPTLEII